jgi:hypothetical protein
MNFTKTVNNLTTDLLFISFIDIHGNGDGDALSALELSDLSYLTPVVQAKYGHFE